MYLVPSLRDSALEILEFNVPFCLGKTRHYFKRCDLFCSFHAVVEVQFGGLVWLDRAANNYKENLNSLYRHPDLTLTIDKALRNIIVSAYSHYIDSWPMNGACVGHRACSNLPCIMVDIGTVNDTSSKTAGGRSFPRWRRCPLWTSLPSLMTRRKISGFGR